ncbi:MAG: oligosaccharide flippase family protein [Bacteroides sp.]|nr:oligosaccharide flippase family protein [Bacteroides sp.]
MELNKTSNTLQAMWVGIGSLFSFGFSLVTAALISRYLTKDDYGTYKQVMYVYNTLLVVFTLGLPRAYSYFLPRIPLREGLSIVNKLNGCFLFLGVIFAGILYTGADTIANVLNNPNLTTAIKIFSPTPIFLLPTMGLDGVLATYRLNKWNAVYSIITRFISILLVALPVVFYKATTEVAVAGFTISSVFTCIIGIILMRLPFRGTQCQKTSVTLKEILTFSLPLMLAGFWGIAEKSADQFFISRWFGEAVFADFANGSLELPFVGMVLSAGAVVLLPLFSQMNSEHRDKTEIIELWKRSAIKAAYILYPLVTFAWFFAYIIMTLLYGDKYIESGTYFRIMLTINFFTIAQYYPILLALGKTRLYSNVLMFAAIAVWGLEYLSVTILANPYFVSVVAIIVRIGKIYIFLLVISKILGCRISQLFPIKELGKVFLSSVIAGGGAFLFISYLLPCYEKILNLIIGFIVFIGILLVLSRLLRIPYFDIIKPLLVRFHK